MKYKPLEIGNLIATKPIVQGGMGVGVSMGKLAGAVAKEGGIGIISAAQIGYKDPEFDNNPYEANLRAIHSELEKARAISPEGIVGFNIMVALKHYREYVIEAAKAGADIIISGAGLPIELPSYVKDYNIKIAPIVSGERAAKIILKMWDRNYSRTADMIVVEGPKAGGHLGFHKKELSVINDDLFEQEIVKIIKVVGEYSQKYNVHIPVVVAGGIDDSKAVRKMMELGADGVQVASRFVASYECDAHENFKKKYIEAEEDDIRIVSSPVGMPGRAIRNSFTDRIDNGEKESIRKCYGCLEKCDMTNIPYCITDKLITSVKGDTDNGLVFCGANTFKIKKMQSVKDIIESLVE